MQEQQKEVAHAPEVILRAVGREATFRMKDLLGPATYLLGLKIDRNKTKNILKISREQYILNILSLECVMQNLCLVQWIQAKDGEKVCFLSAAYI